MEEILCKNEVIEYLNIPDIPKKEFDGKTSFKTGVAVVKLLQERRAYAVCTFDAENDFCPHIVKAFAQEPFFDIEQVFVVPNFMETNVEKMDLDEGSKKAAEELANQVKDMENEGAESEEMKRMKELPEWIFPEIHNKEEAEAWLASYCKTNKIGGKRPKNEDAIKARLLSIWSQQNLNK